MLRIRPFAVLYAAETQSIVGDQIARIALSVLVFDATRSPLATAATYAATLVPAVIGGVVLSRLGDRYPRRLVMIGSDLLRAVCFASMVIDAVPLPIVVALVVIAGVISPAFAAAETSYLAQVLRPEEYRVGTALRLITSQTAQVGGFVLGGAVTAALAPRVALLVDALTFVLSAVLVSLGLRGERGRTATATSQPPGEDGPPSPDSQFAGLWGDVRLRRLVLLTLLVGFFVVPEGLAVPFGNSVGASTTEVGLLLAAGAFGAALGSIGLIRYVAPARREAVAARMAVCCGLPLVVPALLPHVPVALVCWAASGAFTAYVLETTTLVIQSIPPTRRAHYSGVVNALLLGAQGVAMVAFGGVGDVVSPATAIAISGLTGTGLALATRGVHRSGSSTEGCGQRPTQADHHSSVNHISSS